jgi:hypothetical protein
MDKTPDKMIKSHTTTTTCDGQKANYLDFLTPTHDKMGHCKA